MEISALAGFTFQPDFPFVVNDDLFDQVETDPQPSKATSCRRMADSFKYLVGITGIDSHACIADNNVGYSICHFFETHRDMSAGHTEFDGVAQQAVQNLVDLHSVCQNGDRLEWGFERKG